MKIAPVETSPRGGDTRIASPVGGAASGEPGLYASANLVN